MEIYLSEKKNLELLEIALDCAIDEPPRGYSEQPFIQLKQYILQQSKYQVGNHVVLGAVIAGIDVRDDETWYLVHFLDGYSRWIRESNLEKVEG